MGIFLIRKSLDITEKALKAKVVGYKVYGVPGVIALQLVDSYKKSI
jgi:hypothetical protein